MDTLLLYEDPIRIDWTRCPIVISGRFNLRGLLGIKVERFTAIPEVNETAKYKKSLDKLGQPTRRMWLEQKRRLAHSTSLNSLAFNDGKWLGPSATQLMSAVVGRTCNSTAIDRRGPR